MKFSIVITTYNRVSLLKRAIDSALSQTVPCEIVVVDDCSSDGTEAYAHSLGDRIIYHRNFQNLGHSATINTGIEIAQGDWIKLVDDDDYLSPHCIETMMQAIAHSPGAVICSCQAIQVNEFGRKLGQTRRPGPGTIFYIPQSDIHYGMLLEQVPFGTPVQVAFRRDAFLKSGGWDSELDTNCDDIDSWIKISRFGDAVFINRCLTYRTIWQGARNRYIPLQHRFINNMLMKERMYELTSDRHRSYLPTLRDIRNYLKLHWSVVALKQMRLRQSVELAFPAVFSLKAWALLWSAVRSRRNLGTSKVRKLILVE